MSHTNEVLETSMEANISISSKQYPSSLLSSIDLHQQWSVSPILLFSSLFFGGALSLSLCPCIGLFLSILLLLSNLPGPIVGKKHGLNCTMMKCLVGVLCPALFIVLYVYICVHEVQVALKVQANEIKRWPMGDEGSCSLALLSYDLLDVQRQLATKEIKWGDFICAFTKLGYFLSFARSFVHQQFP